MTPSVPSPVPAGAEREWCVFCQKARDERWARTVVRFEPLNPVTPGHMLFVPREHVSDAAENHVLTGLTFEAAAKYAEGRGEAFNLITSAGRAATQTVEHLHVHYVPRRFDDGLALPWSAAVVSSSPATPAEQDAEEWQPEPHVTLFIDDLTALLNDCSQTGDWMAEFPAYIAVWAVRELLQKSFAREIEWAATSDEIVQALRENGEPL